MAPHNVWDLNPVYQTEYWGHYLEFLEDSLDMVPPADDDLMETDPALREEEDSDEEEWDSQFAMDDVVVVPPVTFRRVIRTSDGFDDRTITPPLLSRESTVDLTEEWEHESLTDSSSDEDSEDEYVLEQMLYIQRAITILENMATLGSRTNPIDLTMF
jgi:hypothetical protein